MYIPLTFEGALAKCLFASGGYEGYFLSGSQQWKYHWFTGSADLVVEKGTIDNVQIYVIGGGGAGGNGNTSNGGGGGGGGAINYSMNERLFKGGYAVKVGRGGFAVDAINSPGLNGVSSSFIGSNITLVAGGGGGGGTSSGGTGGLPNGGNGGNGGTTSASNGTTGLLISFASQSALGYGCGGGGASNISNPGNQGYSCNDNSYGAGANGTNFGIEGANRYGMGGGGGNQVSSSADGGSGSVLIQYPIYDYCNNYFNETGSCGCKEITFDSTYPLNYVPNYTGSYIYMPCGEDNFVSGSLLSYAPLTVCAVSNSYYSYSRPSANPATTTVTAGLVTSGNECVSASLYPTTCSVEWFAPTCTSSIVTIYTPSSSANLIYVGKNETTHSSYTLGAASVKYFCISTGSLYNSNQIYPQLLTGDFASLYNTASCNTITLVADWAGKGPGASSTTYYYYACNGVKTSVTLSRPTSNFTGALSASFCRDMITPTYFVRSGTPAPTETLTTGSSCISSYFDTTTCGCP